MPLAPPVRTLTGISSEMIQVAQATGCALDSEARRVLFLMRDEHRILGDLTRRQFNALAKRAYKNLQDDPTLYADLKTTGGK